MDHPADKGHSKNPPPKEGEVWISGTTRIEVREVAPDGRWAQIHCKVSMAGYGEPGLFIDWDKQQPLVNGRFHDSWDRTKEKVSTDVR